MAQFLRPVAVINSTNWDAVNAASIPAAIGTETRNDSSYAQSPENNTASVLLELSSADEPEPGTRTLRYTYRKSDVLGHTINITVSLWQGETLVQEWTHNSIGDSFTLAQQDVTEPITNWSDLRLELHRGGDTGGPQALRRSAQVSWAEFEIPDATSGPEHREVSDSQAITVSEIVTAEEAPEPLNQLITDFSEDTVDEQPFDWIRRWSTIGAWLVREQDNPYGVHVLEWDGDTNEDQLIAWDAIDASGSDAEEMAMAFRTAGDTNGQGRLQVRASGSFANRACYLLNVQVTNNQIQIARMVDGGFSQNWTAAFTINLNTWYLFRFRVENENGDVRLLGKAWQPADLNDPGDDEPASWMIDELDTSATRITTPGWMGVGHFNQSGIKDYAFVSAAINGASAPLPTTEEPQRQDVFDSQAFTVADTVTPSVRVSVADSQALTTVDAIDLDITAQVAVSDTQALGSADELTVSGTAAAADAQGLATVDELATSTSLEATDSQSLTSADAVDVDKTARGEITDSQALLAGETLGTTADLEASDAQALLTVEELRQTAVIAASDAQSLASADAVDLEIGVEKRQVTDSQAIASTEDPTSAATLEASDDQPLLLVEEVTPVADVALSDAAAFSAFDDVALSVDVARVAVSDAQGLVSAESLLTDAAVVAIDTQLVIAGEAIALLASTEVVDSQALLSADELAVDEERIVRTTIDSQALGAAEELGIFANIFVADLWQVGILEGVQPRADVALVDAQALVIAELVAVQDIDAAPLITPPVRAVTLATTTRAAFADTRSRAEATDTRTRAEMP